ncbi:MAG: type II CRISPR-associated endonuclease Cas1 [Candidatus Tectomicrobia bacterium]|uniref:CRISPR-associated endonuclease Cas1 n=1 Tax=Tectimicrobiota bacterium TaxID=2528274 RepID=A0A932I5H1_UNCTE|nr:type II CRISPR-associated endonuclease Cas1 [Candidatus Tectomicrobia bacterium]
MIERVIDISEAPARLSVRNSLLVIQLESGENAIPLAEVAALVVSNPGVTFTHAVLSGLAAAGGIFVACDGRHMPSAMLLPLEGHSTQGERFALQAGVSLPVLKRLWRDLVRAKVRAQGKVLAELRGNDEGLLQMAGRVLTGNAASIEAQASRRYWRELFGDPDFRRNREAEDQNRFLNYGYAVLRAIVARAICGAGLHPSFGLHHHNRYDAFRLADDLMEPFRPVVDRAVARNCEEEGADAPLDKEAKKALIGALTGRFEAEGESRTLFDIAARMAASLAAVYAGKRKSLVLPEV